MAQHKRWMAFFGILYSSSIWALTPLIEDAKILLAQPPSTATESPFFDLNRDVQQGQKHPAVALLRTQWGLVSSTPELFDAEFKKALVQAQKDKGLLPTGILDPNSWYAIYTQPQIWRKQALTQAVESWTKILDTHNQLKTPGNRMLVINVPSMELTVYDRIGETPAFEPVFVSRIVVGKVATKTPFESFELLSLKYNPTWTPTPGMLKRHVYKAGQFDAKWLREHGVKPFNSKGQQVSWESVEDPSQYSFSQPAGDRNALGVLKFETSSKENIYLHDTNERFLFGYNVRAYSSGCIRVEDYLGLASLIQNTTDEALIKKIKTKQTYFEKLHAKVPVYFDYSQVRRLGDESLGFSFDIYSLNKFVTK